MNIKNEQVGPDREQLRRPFGYYLANIGACSFFASLGGGIISTWVRYAPLEAPFGFALLGSAGLTIVGFAWEAIVTEPCYDSPEGQLVQQPELEITLAAEPN